MTARLAGQRWGLRAAAALLRPHSPHACAGVCAAPPAAATRVCWPRRSRASPGHLARASSTRQGRRRRRCSGSRQSRRGRSRGAARPGGQSGPWCCRRAAGRSWRGALRQIQRFPHVGRLDVRVGRTAALAGGTRREARTPRAPVGAAVAEQAHREPPAALTALTAALPLPEPRLKGRLGFFRSDAEAALAALCSWQREFAGVDRCRPARRSSHGCEPRPTSIRCAYTCPC